MTRPAFLIAFFTTIVRYYDYALFGLSATVLSKNFLPLGSNDKQILLFFAIFSIVVISRPVGSIIFGFISDKYSRVVSVKISVFLATISTILIGLTPNFDKIGTYATIILIFCRMTFLMSLAGESDAIKIYVVEKVGKTSKNCASGIVSFCSQVGALLAATIYHFSTEFDSAAYLWRANFIIGGIFGLFIIFLRHYFHESEEFLKSKKDHKSIDYNFFYLTKIVKDSFKKFIIAILISGCIGGIYHFLIYFWGVFAVKSALIMDSNQAQIINIALISIYAIMSVLSGFLADRFYPKKQIIIALSLSLLVIIIVQFLLYKEISVIYFPVMLIGLAPFYVVPLQIIVQSMFITNIRAIMCSLSHSLGGMILSSTTPFFCMLLWQYFNSIFLVLGFFMLLLLILFSTVIFLYSTNVITNYS
ncbi:MAG: MFS transporter [Rickettsia endosymbiont of Sergentomyia squamirostris]|uniref:MFS transporter n=1 Tax=Candidatus Tisiphia endosymbiont of Sergentomyia squamirostris TaxID=3113639 RepID=A0AAT9G728_9RICK